MKKRKQQGHYCRICGRRRPNEKFSGKGHATHICKDCAKKQRSSQKMNEEQEMRFEEDLDYDFYLDDEEELEDDYYFDDEWNPPTREFGDKDLPFK